MLDIVRQLIPQMTINEKREFLMAIKAAIAEDMTRVSKTEPESCPRCGCPFVAKKGHSTSGDQRWKCKGCNKTFSASTLSVIGSSKLSSRTWMEYAECMADALSLRESAERCGVSLPTSWFMRHRICEMMADHLEPFRPGTECHIDSTYLAHSITGNSKTAVEDRTGRHARRCGSDGLPRGISNELVCVMCGASDLGDVFAEVACRGRERISDVVASLSGKVDGAPLVATDMHKSYPKALGALGVAKHMQVDPKKRTGSALSLVDSMHSRLKQFLSRFNGVASKHLQHYLDWFCYLEQYKRSDGDRREMLFRHAASGHYSMRRVDYIRMTDPLAA